MRKYGLAVPVLLGLCLFALAESAAQEMAAAAAAQAPAIRPGTARVWFLRASDSPRGDVQGAAPIVFANQAPVGDLPVNSKFFRDFTPGTYRFTVQAYGLPTPQATTLQLAPGTQAFLQVQWGASWQQGYPEAGFGFAPNTFIITTMSPQLAQAYLPTLDYLGPR
jgi:hypothetical protein